ncbi:dihydrofolate reductase [Thalassovita taeanensis]|uniref:dihydrofolate reductase n=1 Tax=Thalassovita taeanensis TaxID=657014 RepID=A0A1H9HFU6_9RHOB|nr:dihydrofolate reductase [Thalassovita taeanensis]SEQ61185.1 dihydrofolate reductase [Thalassovita taeanensis]
MISLIVARALDGAIGKDNTIPWKAPEDLAFFQRETLGGAVIMGRHTWESLPFKPLKGRLNIVVSSQNSSAEATLRDVQSAIDFAYAQGYRRIYGMGGFGIYKELLPKADRLLITEVDIKVEGADTFFPDVPEADWRRIGTSPLRDADPRCVLHEYLRRVVD